MAYWEVPQLAGVRWWGGNYPSAAAPTSSTVNQTTTYGYDQLYRLTNANNGATTYTYDPVGNRLTKNATSYTYDRADRILTAGSTSYAVNANGNVTARGSDSFAYDQANRLKSATVSGATSAYTYDGDGNRASKTVGTTTTSYVYDVNVSLPNVLTDGTLKYVYGLGLSYTVDGSGNVQVYHTDGLGSVRAITDSNGNVIATYTTDEFGIPTQTQGSATQPFQFTGQQRDAEDGLYYLRARMYDPGIGRFLQRDQDGGSRNTPLTINRYTYSLENPVDQGDPSGFKSRQLGPPILVIDEADFPTKAPNIDKAQKAGYPSTLHYDSDKSRARQRRKSVCGNANYSGECDEYPFASTYEGGDATWSTTGRAATTFPIGSTEHRREGGVIGGFITQNHLQDGDAFVVVVKRRPGPGLPAPLPFPVFFPGLGPGFWQEPEPELAPA